MIVRNILGRASFREEKMGKADLVLADHLFAGLNSFEPGQEHQPHAHCDRDKLYIVLAGVGDVTIDGETERVETGDLALAPADIVHSLVNPGPDRLVVLVLMAPPPARAGS